MLLVRGSGIGKAISVLFAKEVADVIIIGRKQETLEETCKIEPKKISYVIEDITKEESIKNLIEYVKEKFGKLDILVNNVGIVSFKPLKDLNTTIIKIGLLNRVQRRFFIGNTIMQSLPKINNIILLIVKNSIK